MDQNDVVMNLRSCLISCKGGVKLDNLRGDYRMITGESLPYHKFGFPSIEAFIRSMPDFTLIDKRGELYVEAVPTKTTAHLTKLISHQVSRQRVRRKVRPQTKKYSRYTSRGGYMSAFKNNASQSVRNSYHDPSTSFTRSTPGGSNLYTDFSRPMPLMGTIVQCPLLCNNDKTRFSSDMPTVSPSKRLRDKITLNVPALNQSLNKSKNMEEIRGEVLNERAMPSVMNTRPKIMELKSSKLSERLKITPNTLSPTNNNGHTYQSATANISQLSSIDTSDPRKKLKMHANTLELPPPVYKMYMQKAKDSARITIYASVKVGGHTFHTFPDDAKSEEEAEKIAARLALINLAKESLNSRIMTADASLVKERILIIMNRHHSGVFMHQLPIYYSEQYGETLPDNWRRIIEECADINQERGVGNSTILCRSEPTTKHPEAYISSSRELHFEFNSTSSEKIQLNPIGPAAPDKLKVPETTLWNVYITCVMSTVEVWIRLVDDDYNDNFIDMINEMTDHYNQMKEPASLSACIIGDFYAILEDNYWHRVQCIDFESDTGIATVLFIDEGYEDEYKHDLLQPLEKKFCSVPAQAIRIALQGLEDFRDFSHQIIPEIENHLVDRVFCAKVHSTDGAYGGNNIRTVTLYDTSREDDIDMNKVIFDKILGNISDTSKVHVGQLIQLYVTHIDKHGKAYAQLNSFARTCLLNLLNEEIMSKASANIMMNSLVKSIDFMKMYFVQLDSQWYRARVTDILDKREVTVFLIDFGRTVTALRQNLLHMDQISKTLQDIPPQAIQIFLHNIDRYGEKFVKRFNELVSSTDLLLAKVIRVTASGVPIMEIFKRIGPNNMLASINTSLIYDEELTKSIEDSNNNIKPKKRLERKNSRILESYGKLNPPTISDVGQYFDVHVMLAAHPGHFIIQPLNDMSNLQEMMLELQKCYDAYEGPQLESIGEGKLYVAKFKDNYWYRVYVTNIISDNMVSVYLCDFGDVTIVSRSSLQPLKSEFLELPYQAVKAKLIGIQPMNTDWSVEDCLRFQDLVLSKNFVSIVVESMFDHFSPANSTVLGLRLIDVSTDKDIFIDELLVNEKRAKLIVGESLPK